MAYQPPYGYGGYGGQGGTYGQDPYGGQNREAMLRQLAQPDNPNYQYPGGNLQNVRTQTGKANTIADAGVGLAWEGTGGAAGAGIGQATGMIADRLKPQGQAATVSPYGDLTDQYGRRMEGSGEGIAGGAVKWGGRGAQLGLEVGGPIGAGIGGAVGAIGGAIGNAFTKNAKSAYSDFRTQDAVDAIKQMYLTRGGRLPTEQDIETILIGQGMDRADAQKHTGFVGEHGLYSVLNSLDKNFAAERGRLVDQAVGAPGAPSTPGAPAGAAPAGASPTTPQPVPQTPMPGRGPVDPQFRMDRGAPGSADRAQLLASPGDRGGQLGGSPTGPTPPNTPVPPVLGAEGTYHLPGTPGGAPAAPGAPSGIPPSTPPPQAPPVAPQPGAPPAPPAAAPAPSLPANADTDGYAKPAYTAATPSSAPPPGWDAKKWSDPAHQTPKYVVGRIMSQFAPTTENMPKVLAEIQKAYPGTRLVGKDSIEIPGVGTTDILRAADVGGKGWQWLGASGKGKTSGGGGGGTGGAGTGAGYNAAGDVAGGDVINQIIANLGGIAGGGGGQNAGPMSARDALIAQLGIHRS